MVRIIKFPNFLPFIHLLQVAEVMDLVRLAANRLTCDITSEKAANSASIISSGVIVSGHGRASPISNVGLPVAKVKLTSGSSAMSLLMPRVGRVCVCACLRQRGLPLAFAPDCGRPPLLPDIGGVSKNFGFLFYFLSPLQYYVRMHPSWARMEGCPRCRGCGKGLAATGCSEPAPMLPSSAHDLSLATRQLPVSRTTRQAGSILPTTLTHLVLTHLSPT